MEHILCSLLSEQTKTQSLKFDSDLYSVRYKKSESHVDICFQQFNESFIDFCYVFDKKTIDLIVSRFSSFRIDITNDHFHNFDQRVRRTQSMRHYSIKKKNDEISINISISNENKGTRDAYIDLLKLHLGECFDCSMTTVKIQSQDLWIQKKVYDLFIEHNVAVFICGTLTITNEKTHHYLDVTGSSNLDYLDRSLVYRVFINKLKLSSDIEAMFMNYLVLKLQRLKISKIHMREIMGIDFNLDHPEYLKTVCIGNLCLDNCMKRCLFKKWIMFADKLKVKSFDNFKREKSHIMFNIMSKSILRKIHIESIKYNDIQSNDFKKLKQMKHLVSLKLMGQSLHMDNELIDLLITTDQLQVFCSNYIIPNARCESISKRIQETENRSMYKLSVCFENEYEKKCIRDIVCHYSDLTNLEIHFKSQSDARFLYGIIMSKQRNKLSQFSCCDVDGEDNVLHEISKFNSFKSIVQNWETMKHYKQIAKEDCSITPIGDFSDKYENGRTIAHLLSKIDVCSYMGNSQLKQLEDIPCMQRQWLPSTYLSLNGNPVVKRMFSEKNKDVGLGNLNIDILCVVFEYISGSIWEETLLHNLPRVNRNFYQSAQCFRYRMINNVRRLHGLETIEIKQVDKNMSSNKLKRCKYDDQEDVENSNQKKRKVFPIVEIK